MEAWFRLAAEAARGTTAAQEALNALMQAGTPEEFMQRMTQLAPGAGAGAGAGIGSHADASVTRMWEEWWRMMGFVPRTRYLELLEENDSLRRRLRAAEASIEQLRAQQDASHNFQQGAQQASEQVQKATQAWEDVFQQMLDAQSQWMQRWSDGEQRGEQKEANDPTDDAPSPRDDAAPPT